MSDTLFAAIIGATIGGTIGICGTYYGHRLTRSTALETIRIAEFNKGAAAFRAAFVNEIVLLRKSIASESKRLDDIITEVAFISHEKAKIMFEPFLTASDLSNFNAAWNKYRNYQAAYIKENYLTKNSTVEGLSKYCLVQIDNLLAYAKLKI